jgi:hypothetical protein
MKIVILLLTLCVCVSFASRIERSARHTSNVEESNKMQDAARGLVEDFVFSTRPTAKHRKAAEDLIKLAVYEKALKPYLKADVGTSEVKTSQASFALSELTGASSWKCTTEADVIRGFPGPYIIKLHRTGALHVWGTITDRDRGLASLAGNLLKNVEGKSNRFVVDFVPDGRDQPTSVDEFEQNRKRHGLFMRLSGWHPYRFELELRLYRKTYDCERQ